MKKKPLKYSLKFVFFLNFLFSLYFGSKKKFHIKFKISKSKGQVINFLKEKAKFRKKKTIRNQNYELKSFGNENLKTKKIKTKVSKMKGLETKKFK